MAVLQTQVLIIFPIPNPPCHSPLISTFLSHSIQVFCRKGPKHIPPLSPYPLEESSTLLGSFTCLWLPLEHYQQNKVNKSIIMRSILSERKRQICLHACCDQTAPISQESSERTRQNLAARDQYLSSPFPFSPGFHILNYAEKFQKSSRTFMNFYKKTPGL